MSLTDTAEPMAITATNDSLNQDATDKSRKEKRAQRNAERALQTKRGKKRKLADDVEETDQKPASEELQKDFIPLPADDGAEETTPAAKTGNPKKRKLEQAARAQDGDNGAAAQTAKKKRRPKSAEAPTGETATKLAKPANQRFIVFLGNLPYTTTDASLQTHFKSLQPFTLRHRTDPKTKKSKGFAFLEFENYDRMKTCLKLYHHSYFDPESPEKSKLASEGEPEPEPSVYGKRAKRPTGRKINVELTAGGGGSTENRKEKIKVKNVRLEEQRARRAEVERKEKLKKDGKAARKDGVVTKDVPATANTDGMHPSRMAMIGN